MSVTTMMLLTKANKAALPALYAQDGKGMDATVYVKFFNPCGSETYYITEYDGEDTMFGYVTGSWTDELGYISLSELAAVKGPLGIGIERDRHFSPATINECVAKGA